MYSLEMEVKERDLFRKFVETTFQFTKAESTGGACDSWWPNGGYAPVGCGGVMEQLTTGGDLTPVPNGTFIGSRGSVKDCTCFNVGRDVDNLRKAIVGLGTNEQAIIEILTHRSNWQRQLICKEYKATCGRELIDDLKGDLSGDFKKVIISLVLPPALFDAKELERAMRGPGTNESTLIEILATRSNQQLKEIKEAYHSEFKKDLPKDIAAETSGDFKRALLILLEARRDENCQIVDERLFKSDAQALYKAGEKRLGTDEAKFIEVLCLRSPVQLQITFDEYKAVTNKTIEDSIKSEMSGDLKSLMLTMANCSKSVPAYFAERIHQSVKGLGTDENTLSRIMVSRSEIDLLDIQDEYMKLYGGSLYATIKDETSGDYKTALLKLCGTGN
ncbi:annexin A3-like isoform X1 [Scyliorhinus canicula]|uniref:annexin A3-like isoform X1 n=1 Tax=Scyliorhinus canicula TaxID=7830 RepID=UPI0018F64AA4|nr:annexin A3-like isoform X1 [Scyliorhinus canicula]